MLNKIFLRLGLISKNKYELLQEIKFYKGLYKYFKDSHYPGLCRNVKHYTQSNLDFEVVMKVKAQRLLDMYEKMYPEDYLRWISRFSNIMTSGYWFSDSKDKAKRLEIIEAVIKDLEQQV